jgi:hypothetical protein
MVKLDDAGMLAELLAAGLISGVCVVTPVHVLPACLARSRTGQAVDGGQERGFASAGAQAPKRRPPPSDLFGKPAEPCLLERLELPQEGETLVLTGERA